MMGIICLYHIIYLLYTILILKRPFPIKMVISLQDLSNFLQELGYFLGLRKERLQPVNLEDSIDQSKQKLFVELAELDDDFEDGRIPEETYRKLRAEKKAQLIALMQRQKEE